MRRCHGSTERRPEKGGGVSPFQPITIRVARKCIPCDDDNTTKSVVFFIIIIIIIIIISQ